MICIYDINVSLCHLTFLKYVAESYIHTFVCLFSVRPSVTSPFYKSRGNLSDLFDRLPVLMVTSLLLQFHLFLLPPISNATSPTYVNAGHSGEFLQGWPFFRGSCSSPGRVCFPDTQDQTKQDYPSYSGTLSSLHDTL